MPKPVDVARGYLHVREDPAGSNRSPEIDRWNTAVGAPLHSAWCAAFVYGCFTEAGEAWPWKRSGRVQTLVDSGALVDASEAKPGDVVVFYFTKLKRYAHVGLVVSKVKSALLTIEGNTIADGAAGDTREGWGVFAKRRAITPKVKILRAAA